MAEKTVAIIDGGGRGVVLAEKYLQSAHVGKLIAIPGNDWVKQYAKIYQKEVLTFPSLKTTDLLQIIKICKQQVVDQINVAQDNALATGLVDLAIAENIQSFGPTRKASKIEWSKSYARWLGQKIDLPQPNFKICRSKQDYEELLSRSKNQSFIIKADGLCEGKGVLFAKNRQQLISCVENLQKFKDAAKTFLIEEWLKNEDGSPGIEFSAFALTDGFDFQILNTAKDHKRVNNFDQGENTGGMGCISPHPTLNVATLQHIEEIFDKTITGLRKVHRPYQGVLYLGGMVVERAGKRIPYVVEFNARWGDPEAQSILPGIQNDLYELEQAVINSEVKNLKIETDNLYRVVVAGVTRGYPEDSSVYNNKEIFGVEEVIKLDGTSFYGAGMKIIDGHYFTPKKPARLFYVVGEGANLLTARNKAYKAINQISIPNIGLHYRTDIAFRDLAKPHLI